MRVCASFSLRCGGCSVKVARECAEKRPSDCSLSMSLIFNSIYLAAHRTAPLREFSFLLFCLFIITLVTKPFSLSLFFSLFFSLRSAALTVVVYSLTLFISLVNITDHFVNTTLPSFIFVFFCSFVVASDLPRLIRVRQVESRECFVINFPRWNNNSLCCSV